MPDTKRKALVAYALSMAWFRGLDGGELQGRAARAALEFLREPPPDAAPADSQAWRDAEAELKKLGGIG